jgi:adenine-specific DNA methylase
MNSKADRKTTIALFSNFTDEMLLKEGNCFNVKISVLALGFVIVCHPLHHYYILKESYFIARFDYGF